MNRLTESFLRAFDLRPRPRFPFPSCCLNVLAATWLLSGILAQAQTLEAPNSSSITSTSASLGALLSSDGGTVLTEGGVVFSEKTSNANPLVGGKLVVQIKANPPTIGNFNVAVPKLSPATAYSFKAYVKNASGTHYSGVATFTTNANQAPVIAMNGQVQGFTKTGNLAQARAYHTAVLLRDGKVLVTGGASPSGLGQVLQNSSELFDPATENWTPTGSLSTRRFTPAVVLLPSGWVLAAGGGGYVAGIAESLSSAELYNPTTGTWIPTGSMAYGRAEHTATLLANGLVLVTGGTRLNAPSELYDPNTGVWSDTGKLSTRQAGHTSILMSDGKVLLAGGSQSMVPSELYDPETGVWGATGALSNSRYYLAAVRLANGKALVVGGTGHNGAGISTELYDPISGIWTPTGNLNLGRWRHTANLLPNGDVLVSGGKSATATYSATLPTSELFNPVTGKWSPASKLTSGRANHTATSLPDGRVLLAGGEFLAGSIGFEMLTYGDSSEIYHPTDTLVTGTEGSRMVLDGTFSDAEGNATITLTSSTGTIVPDFAAGKWEWSTTGLDGPATGTVTISAKDAFSPQVPFPFLFTLITTNLPPAAHIAVPAAAKVGESAAFAFTATDQSLADESAGFEWTIDFGDDSQPTKTAPGAASFLLINHKFEHGGVYSIRATAKDKDGGVSGPVSTPVVVSGNTALKAWRRLNFPEDTEVDMLDADGDGLVNLIEFAFGLDPKSGASAQLPLAKKIGNQLMVSFDQPSGISGSISYGAEWSPNMLPESWMKIPDSGTGQTHTFSVLTDGQRHVFIRLSVTSL